MFDFRVKERENQTLYTYIKRYTHSRAQKDGLL